MKRLFDDLSALNKSFQQMDREFDEAMGELSQAAKEIRRMADEFKNRVGWSKWEPYVLKWPKRINGRWYWRGDTVYRKEKMKYLTGSGEYQYGDEFDILREQQAED